MAKIEYSLDRDIFDEAIREIAKKKVVLDIGAGSPFRKELSKYKSIFKNNRYYSLDIKFHPELELIGDAQSLPFKDRSIDGLICKGLLSCVFEPQKVVQEIYRVLKEGGIVYVSLLFLYPFHEGTGDYYRFTKDAILRMFEDFREIKLQPNGGYVGTTLNFVTGFKLKKWGLLRHLHIMERFLERIVNLSRERRINRLHNTTGFNILIKK